MRVRYVGPEDAIELAVPGACLTFPRGKWLDPEKVALAASVPVHHLDIILGSLGEAWEIEDESKPDARKGKASTSDDEETGR